MSLRAVLDANVLVPIALCDALLHLFPRSACEALGIEAIRPDDFLLRQLGREPVAVRDAIAQQIADLTNTPMSPVDLLGTLRTWAPRFVAAFSKDLGIT